MENVLLFSCALVLQNVQDDQLKPTVYTSTESSIVLKKFGLLRTAETKKVHGNICHTAFIRHEA